MADFNIRSDSVNVEEIMRQIRARIREKRGVDYTEQEIRELAAVKLETFLDPSRVRSDLLEQYRQMQRDRENPKVELDEETLFGSPRPWLRRLRRLLRPILKLFVNPVPLMRAARLDTVRQGELFYELMHNLVIETTRLGIELKNLKMRVESLSSRLDFDERRARALEGVVQYRPAAPAPVEEPAPAAGRPNGEESESEPAGSRSRRRRRRRGRRGGQRGPAEEGGAVREGGQAPAGQRPQDQDWAAAERETTAESGGGAPCDAERADSASNPAGTPEAGDVPPGDRGSREPGA